MRTPSFDVKILVEKCCIMGGYLQYVDPACRYADTIARGVHGGLV